MVLVVIALGLGSRRFPSLLPAVLGKYPGDALWTLMVLCVLAALWPRLSPARLALSALCISFAVEFLQLWQTSWLLAIRDTTLGRLALGTTFGWPDLLAYTAGALSGFLIDHALARFRRP